MNTPERLLGKAAIEAAFSAFPTEIIHTQNLKRSRQYLEQRKGSLLVYMNHFHRLDTMVAGSVIKDFLTPIGNNVYIFVAQQYVDENRTENKKFVSFVKLSQQLYGFNLLPVVQDKPEELTRYPNWRKIARVTFDRAEEAINTPGNVICFAPEGTRSQTGELGEGKRGIEMVMKRANKDFLIQPLVLIPAKIRPLVTRTRVVSPESFTYSELVSEQRENPDITITTLAMQKLARELPLALRGTYV